MNESLLFPILNALFFLAQCCDCKSKSIAGPQPGYDYFVVQMSLEKLFTDLTLAVYGFILQL